MANYIQLFDKSNGEAVSFQIIDEKLCAALGVPCDEKRYFGEWYDIIGYSRCDTIAAVMEKTAKWNDIDLNRALAWLDEHYSLNAWCSR
jgi:hypothetical protein